MQTVVKSPSRKALAKRKVLNEFFSDPYIRTENSSRRWEERTLAQEALWLGCSGKSLLPEHCSRKCNAAVFQMLGYKTFHTYNI